MGNKSFGNLKPFTSSNSGPEPWELEGSAHRQRKKKDVAFRGGASIKDSIVIFFLAILYRYWALNIHFFKKLNTSNKIR